VAGKNQVTLTFAGDSKSLEDSFDKVGKGAEDMGDNVGRGAEAFDRVGDSADNAEGKMTGLASGIDGVTTLMDDPSPQEFAQGLADIADGIGNFLIPSLKTAVTSFASNAAAAASSAATHVAAAATTVAGWVLMGVQATLNAAKMAAAWLISLGPIGLVIAAVAAIIAILVALGVDFEDVKNAIGAAWTFIKNAAMGVFNWLKTNWPLVLAIITGPIGLAVLAITRNWDTIKRGFTAVKDWIGNRISDIVGFITGLPGRISRAASGMFSGISGAFRSAINSIISLWNGLSFPSLTIGGQDPLGSFGPSLPTVTIGGWDLPNIPYLHTGGTFQAPGGQREGLAMLLDGERVLKPGDTGAVTVNVYAPLISSTQELMRMVGDEFRRGGFTR
jgi:hypothetical protein